MGIRAAKTPHGDTDWRLRLSQYVMDHGADPLSLSAAGLVVASGIDGRYRGAVRRFLGTEAVPESLDGHPFINSGQKTPPIQEMYPFRVDLAGVDELNGWVILFRNNVPSEDYNYLVFLYHKRSTNQWYSDKYGDGSGALKTITTVEGETRVIAGPTSHIKVASWRNFVYILSGAGTSQLVAWYESDAVRWRFGIFGPGIPTDAMTMQLDTAPTGTTYRSLQGRVFVKAQLRDTHRLRRSGYSTELDLDFAGTKEQRVAVKVELTHATYGQYIKDANSTTPTPYGFDQIEFYATENTQDKDKAPGGYYFFMDSVGIRDNYSGSQQLLEKTWLYSNAYVNNEAAAIGTLSELDSSDLNLITSRFIDKTLDSHGTLTWCLAAYDFQDITFIVTIDSSGQTALRWSIPHRIEKENFPDINSLFVGMGALAPIQFAESTDYLWLFGDGPYWRFRKVNTSQGSLLETVKFGTDLSLVSRNAIVAVGNMIYLVTDKGVVEFDGIRGTHNYVEGLSRIITERWVNNLADVSCCYDQRLDAVFILNPVFEEMAVLWFKSGRLTLLTGCPFEMASTLKLNGKAQAFFRTKWVADWNGPMQLVTPRASKYNSSGVFQPLTMNGILNIGNYNAPVLSVINTGLRYVTTLDAQASSGGQPLGFLVYGIKGTCRGNVYRVNMVTWVGLPSKRLVLGLIPAGLFLADVAVVGPAIGDVLALSPVPLDIIGGPLSGFEGDDPDLTLKKSVATMQASVRRVDGTVPPATDLLYFGCASLDELHSEIAVLPDSQPLRRWDNIPNMGALSNADLATTDGNLIRAVVSKAGYDLFPVLRCFLSNVDFSLHEIVCNGKVPQRGFVKSPV